MSLASSAAVWAVRNLAPAAFVAGAYTLTAIAGLRLALGNENVTVFWPPTGIAVAALLLRGNRVWPGIAAGAVIANLANGAPLHSALAIAAGNTLAPLAASWLLKRARFRPSLDRVADVLALIFLGGFASMLLSAAGGTMALLATGLATAADAREVALVWWVGDAMGVVLVAPLVLVVGSSSAVSGLTRLSRLSQLELFGLVAVAGTGTYLLFEHLRVPLAMLVVLLGVWAALRLEQLGAAVVTLAASVAGTIATARGLGPFSSLDPTSALLSLQTFNLALAVSALVPAAVIRDRRAAKETLERWATESLAEAQALSHVGSWRWDLKSNRVTWSDELYRIYGVEPSSFAATFESYLARVHPDHVEQVRSVVSRAYSELEAFEHEYRIMRPSGEERWVHARGEPVIENGVVVALRGFCQDVTERARAETVLRDALDREREVAERLRSLDEMKSAFLGAVSHELRTPLSVVLGLTDSLRTHLDEVSPEQAVDFVDRIGANARRLERLLLDVLDLDRLARGIIEARRRPVDVCALVRRLAVENEGPLDRPVSVTGEPVVAPLDPGLVERIVENLLINSVRHTPPGTPIWVRVEDSAEGVVICVDDAGPGVPDDLRETIFEPFRQGHGVTKGTGLGLSLARRFAMLHGGDVTLHDRPGGGASFRVLLPREGDPILDVSRRPAASTV